MPSPHTLPAARRLIDYAVAGVVGDLLVRAARGAVGSRSGRALLVGATAGGLRGVRRLEQLAEEARLAAGDVLAEARASMGEAAPPPTTPSPGVADDHGHAH